MRLHTKTASHKSKALCGKLLNKLGGLKQPRKNFILSTMILFLSMGGRRNFKGMERYGERCEKTYRLQFEKRFDFLVFNIELSKESLSDDCVLVFDPSYLPKSGKHTPGMGKFWSGCLGKAIQGIEIGGLGIVDMLQNTAFNLEAIQTPSPASLKATGKTLVDHYAEVIITRFEQIRPLSKYLAVDGYFSKVKFVDSVLSSTTLEIISKLRCDANLNYLYDGPKRAGRGRPKKFDGKVDLKNIDKKRFKEVYRDEEVIVYENIVWVIFLKRKVKISYVEFLDQGKPTNRYAVYFSTDLELGALKIYRYYKARFQIEFLFRDAKQFTGLTHCQARSENKIHFHTNMALTSVSVAKVAHYINEQKEQNKSFSIADVKTIYFNELMLNLFLSNFHIDPNIDKNKQAYNFMLNFGAIAA